MKFHTPPRVSTLGQALVLRADPPGRRYKADPVRWAKERASIDLWSKQREIIQSVRDNPQTAVHSCHETGKSFVAAITACWWLDVHEPGEAFVVTTAPTQPQVEAILWREINRVHARAGLRGRTNLTEWYMGKELVAFGRKPSDYNTSAFQGVHARFFLVILDEACGIPKQLWDSASTLGANQHSRQLAIGNPDDPAGEFFDNCQPGSGWDVIKIGCTDTPNFTGEHVEEIVGDSLIHPHWVEGRRKKWGAESALFQSKCLGEFPTMGDPFTVVPHSWATKCRFLELLAKGDIEAGVDVGGGGDRTIVQLRQGPRALDRFEFVSADPMQTVGNICRILRERKVKRVKVDVIGIGWGVYGRIKELSSVSNSYGKDHTHDAEVIPINFAESPPLGFEDKYLNMRAYAHWEIGREYSRLGKWDLSQVDDDLIHELTTPRYEIIDSSGRLKIESKDKVIKRLGHSPDLSDAILLAYVETFTVATPPPMELLERDIYAESRQRDPSDSNRFDNPFGARPF